MVRNTFKSLWSHKRRLISTVIAIVLGVAFMAGTLVLTSTINNVFDDLFAGSNQSTDAVIRGQVFSDSGQGGKQRTLLDQTMVDKVRKVPGVAQAVATVTNVDVTLLDKKDDPVGGQGPPTFVESWKREADLNDYRVAEGQPPRRPGEAVVDRSTAKQAKFRIGDDISLISAKGRTKLKLVGIVRYGDADSAGGVVFVGTTLARAQRFSGQPDRINNIDVKADAGVSSAQLVSRLKQADLGAKTSIVTGRQAADETANEVKDAFSFFSTILLVFAGVALFVGIFIISNTFSILVAQRTKELALMRALGASRGQVLASVLAEAAVIGLISAILGFFAGVGLAAGAFALLRSIGLDLPSAGLAVTPQAAIAAVIVGVGVTAFSAIIPAVRATRVPPLAALRDVAVDQSGRSKLRAAMGVLMLIAGAGAVIPAFGTDPESSILPRVGIGLALILTAVLVLGPVLARPLATVVGAPLPILKGVTGRLARRNAVRSPRRTASTAAALIIGVTLVGFITVFASSAQKSITQSVSGGFKGDYIVQPTNFNGGLTGVPPKVATAMAKVKGVRTVAPLTATGARIELERGRTSTGVVAGIDADRYQQVFKTSMKQGRFSPLGADKVIVDRELARTKGIKVGDRITIRSFADKSARYEVAGIGDDLGIISLYGLQYAVSRDGFAKIEPNPSDFLLGIRLDKGTSLDSVRPELKSILKPYPTMRLQDRDQFTGSLVAQIKALLNVIYALLAVSIIIALIGIANTLSLSINERTRELGLMRAMGMSRRQLRSSVRWEAVIVALMGTGIGVILGLGLSWILVKALASQGINQFSVPVTGLVVEVVFGAGLGIVASLRPAWKAAKLNVLEAIATE